MRIETTAKQTRTVDGVSAVTEVKLEVCCELPGLDEDRLGGVMGAVVEGALAVVHELNGGE